MCPRRSEPAEAVFKGFDNTLILAEGRAAYFGLASSLGDYLDSIGFPVNGGNPAEKMLDLINRDFTDDSEVDVVLAKFKGAPPITSEKKAMPSSKAGGGASMLRQTATRAVDQRLSELLNWLAS